MDYIVDLPITKDGYNAIPVFIDRLTKMTHLFKCTTNVDSLGIAQLFVDHVWKLHGTPQHIVSDKCSTFVGKFMTEVLRLIGAKHNRSSPSIQNR
jgi:NAD-dependent SIR2 family protein deacetylase